MAESKPTIRTRTNKEKFREPVIQRLDDLARRLEGLLAEPAADTSKTTPEEERTLSQATSIEDKAAAAVSGGRRDRNLAQLADVLGRALTQYGAAREGAKAGVDAVSGLNLKPLSFEGQAAADAEIYKSSIGSAGILRKAVQQARTARGKAAEASRKEKIAGVGKLADIERSKATAISALEDVEYSRDQIAGLSKEDKEKLGIIEKDIAQQTMVKQARDQLIASLVDQMKELQQASGEERTAVVSKFRLPQLAALAGISMDEAMAAVNRSSSGDSLKQELELLPSEFDNKLYTSALLQRKNLLTSLGVYPDEQQPEGVEPAAGSTPITPELIQYFGKQYPDKSPEQISALWSELDGEQQAYFISQAGSAAKPTVGDSVSALLQIIRARYGGSKSGEGGKE